MIYILKAAGVNAGIVPGSIYIQSLELYEATKPELESLRKLTDEEFGSTDAGVVTVQAIEAVRTAPKDQVIAIEDFFTGRKATLIVDDRHGDGAIWAFAPTKTQVKVTYVDYLLKK
ncbi:MAG: hypothetical protein ACREAU_01815 [Nitrosopumilaceae archaeon]